MQDNDYNMRFDSNNAQLNVLRKEIMELG